MANQLKVGATMVLPETRFPQFRSARNQKNIAGRNLMENIVHENGTTGGVVSCDVDHQEDGVVRMKILVKKQDIEQVLLQVLKFGKSKAHDVQPSIRPPPASLSAEQGLINLLRKKRLSRANNNGAKQAGSRSSWSPALQSIPEELQA